MKRARSHCCPQIVCSRRYGAEVACSCGWTARYRTVVAASWAWGAHVRTALAGQEGP